MNEILKVEIMDYQTTPPKVAANFWWSAERGVTCDDAELLARLNQEGILLPDQKIVYPRDGRPFLNALPFRFTGLERAQPAIAVSKQEGSFV